MLIRCSLRFRVIWAAVGLPFLFAGLSCTASGEAAAAEQNPGTVFKSSAQEILLDFVARDKHHNAVKDLSVEDIEVYQDGVRQTPRAFRYRDGSEARTLAAPKDGTTFDPLREINIVSIVFESMSPESRSRATRLTQELAA